MTERPASSPTTPTFKESGALDSMISVGAFIALDRIGGLGWAIAGATAWSLKATYTKHRRGQRIGWMLPVTTLYLAVRGAIGIITGSRAVYFGISIGTKIAIGLALIGSVLIGRAALRLHAHKALAFPEEVRAHPIYRSTMNQLTVIAGAYEVVSAGADVWLYNNAPKGGFVLIRVLVNSVGSFVAIFGAIIFADTRLRKIPGFGGLLDLVESTMHDRTHTHTKALETD